MLRAGHMARSVAGLFTSRMNFFRSVPSFRYANLQERGGVSDQTNIDSLEHQGARFYSLTKAGRKQLAIERSKWDRLSAGVNLVMQRT